MRRNVQSVFKLTLFAVPFAAAFLLRCTPAGTQAVVKTVLDVLDYVCITANADLPNASSIAVACHLEKDLEPAIVEVVKDFTAKRATYAASKCGK